jgi:crotonobetainyl-CoA:carnitine CoA-transferase CaiB-like acyl-CoA transferase
VLDLSTDHAGAFCTRLFSTAVASVTVAEPPGGSPLRHAEPLLPDGRSAVWEYVAAYKDGATAPIDEDALVAAAGRFDVVVLSFEGDPASARARADRLRAAHPALVVVVTSPFGLTGPYAGYRAGPLGDWASGGYLSLNGEPDRPPVPGGGPFPSYLVGGTAAVGAQAALVRARRTGQGDVVDVGAMEAIGCGHQWSVVIYTHQGIVKRRWGNRHGEAHHPLALFPCRDGWVCIGSVTRNQWEGLCIAMDQVELLARDELYTPATRFDLADELDPIITAWTSAHTTKDVVEALQANHCPAGPVRTLADSLADEHLELRGFWADADAVVPGARMAGQPFQLGERVPFRPAPAPGAAVLAAAGPRPTARSAEPSPPSEAAPDDLPLAGIGVLEFSVAWAGPLAGRFMADLGADVIKLEHPTSRGLSLSGPGGERWDPAKWTWGTIPGPEHRNGTYPDADPGEHWWNRLGYFNKINRGKRSLCIDLKAPGGREVFEELVRRADVVVNNYSPRGVRSLGIDRDTLRAINPKIVTIDLSGFGATGPGAEQVSWGPILDATSGMAEATGYADSGPYKQGLAFPDAVGGVHGAFAILAALHERDRTDGPVHLDISQQETLLGLAGDLALWTSVTGTSPARRGARSLTYAPAGVYRCAGDDDWLALTVRDDAEWAALVDTIVDEAEPAARPLDDPAWASVEGRFAGHDEIDKVIEAWLAGRSKHDAMDELQAAGVAAVAVMTNKDLVEDRHMVARGFMVTLDHVDVGPRGFPGFPIHFDGSATDLKPTPALGAHNHEVLREIGRTDADIAALAAAGTIADRPPD